MWGVSKYSYQSAPCWLCSSFFCIGCQQIYVLWSSRSENPGVYAAELRPRAKPGYVHSLGCDPVKFSQDLGRANLTLASTQNRRLFASKPTSELLRKIWLPHPCFVLSLLKPLSRLQCKSARNHMMVKTRLTEDNFELCFYFKYLRSYIVL